MIKLKNPCLKSYNYLKTLKNNIIKKNKTTKNKTTKNKTKTLNYIKQLFKIQNTKKSIIPLNIYQVWHDKSNLPESVKESIELLKKQNPEFTHYLFDQKECRDFIEKNYSKKILHTYDAIIPYAIKTDLWRYCYMYKYGGIYLDIKYYCINNFKLILLTDKEYFCKDLSTSLDGIYNAIFICKPKNKIFDKAINKIIINVKNKYYGPEALCPTGPLMLKSFFTENQITNFKLTNETVNKSNRFINLNNYRILKYNEKYATEKAQNSDHWFTYWRNKTMYK